MSHQTATRGAGSSTSPRRFADAVVRTILAVLGLLLLVVLVMAWAPQLLDPMLLALGI